MIARLFGQIEKQTSCNASRCTSSSSSSHPCSSCSSITSHYLHPLLLLDLLSSFFSSSFLLLILLFYSSAIISSHVASLSITSCFFLSSSHPDSSCPSLSLPPFSPYVTSFLPSFSSTYCTSLSATSCSYFFFSSSITSF